MIYGDSALPPVDQSLLPADVQKGSAADKKDYQAALGFERMLLGEMTKAMTATTNMDGSSDDSSGADSTNTDDSTSTDDSASTDPATSQLLSMLPDQLADSMIAGGGVGLADSFYHAIKQGQSS